MIFNSQFLDNHLLTSKHNNAFFETILNEKYKVTKIKVYLLWLRLSAVNELRYK